MKKPIRQNRLIALAILAISVLFISCGSGFRLLPLEPSPIGKISISGNLCTEGPLITTSRVKVLFIMDGSDSLWDWTQMDTPTDPNNLRIQAVQDVIDTYAPDPNISFGITLFNFRDRPGISPIYLTSGFTDNLTTLTTAIEACSNENLPQYTETALAEGIDFAKEMIQADINATSDLNELANTLYVAILFTDGAPWYLNNWIAQWSDKVSHTLASVDSFMELSDRNVRGIVLNSVLLGNEDSDFSGATYEDVVALMTEVASRGQGTFTNYEQAEELAFLNIISDSMSHPYNFQNFTASNLNMQIININGETAMNPDTDSDGIVDVTEKNMMLNHQDRDSDGDGCGDGFEMIAGFDPKLGDCGCTANTIDSDHDKLTDCEENILGTDPAEPDSDSDFMIDSYEVFSGLNPMDSTDKYGDLDDDGERNLWEFIFHTNPALANDDFSKSLKYQYRISLKNKTPDGLYCYDIEVSNISVLYTAMGTNNIQLTAVQRSNSSKIFSLGNLEVNILDENGSPEKEAYSLTDIIFHSY